MKYSVDFVLKVNEVFHNIEGDEYSHPECVHTETRRWQKIGKLIGKNPEKKIILDIGSGLGFIPLQIAPYLKETDLFICSDLSSNLLEICRERIIEKKFRCSSNFLKVDGKRYKIESNKLDYITLNSVLHHIPNFETFFKEVDRMLKTNGRLILGHEPNKFFLDNPLLWYNFRFLHFLFNPKVLFIKVSKILRLYKTGKKKIQNFTGKNEGINEQLIKINNTLLNEKIIKQPLTLGELTEIVDIHSPTAGGIHREKGIDISNIIETYLPNFKVEFFESYNHILKLSHRNKITKIYDNLLKRIFPTKGAIFFTVLKKHTFNLIR